jgi:hypothetical protein
MQIVTMSGDGLVGPYVHLGLERAAFRADIDPEAVDYFNLIAQANRDRNAMLKSQLEECNAAFASAGIDITVIKGGALLARVPQSADVARIVGDLDVLLSPSDVDAADRVLRSLGYERVQDSEWGHGAGSYERADCAGAIDVHVRLPDDIAAVLGELDQRSEMVRLGEAEIRVPDPGFHILLNVAHELLHDRGLATGYMELRYLLELDAFTKLHASAVDWAWVAEKTQDARLRLCLEVQDRMAVRVLGRHLFPMSRRTLKGKLLHARRIGKANFVKLGDLEWDVVLFIKGLLRHLPRK